MNTVLTIKMTTYNPILTNTTVWKERRYCMHVEIRRQLKGIDTLFPTCGIKLRSPGLVEDTFTCWAISTSSLTKLLEYLITKWSCYLATAKFYFLTRSLRLYNTINTKSFMIPMTHRLAIKASLFTIIPSSLTTDTFLAIFPGGQCRDNMFNMQPTRYTIPRTVMNVILTYLRMTSCYYVKG